jgi:hypothetical protein
MKDAETRNRHASIKRERKKKRDIAKRFTLDSVILENPGYFLISFKEILDPENLPFVDLNNSQLTVIYVDMHRVRAVSSIEYDTKRKTLDFSTGVSMLHISNHYFLDDQDCVCISWQVKGHSHERFVLVKYLFTQQNNAQVYRFRLYQDGSELCELEGLYSDTEGGIVCPLTKIDYRQEREYTLRLLGVKQSIIFSLPEALTITSRNMV